MPSLIDYSQPLSVVLRESTKEVHQEIQHRDGATALLSGKLPKDEYCRFLVMLWYIYDTFERALDRHSTHPFLEPTYNPPLLARSDALASDISHILQVPESSWKTHRIHKELLANTPPALTEYIERIQELANSDDPSRLLAHSYVRYLGDLSGGQNMRHTLGKAYGLDSEKGLSFYIFKELQTSKPASLGEMKRIKDWFRAGIDMGSTDAREEVKVQVAEEAKNVFQLNNGIFNAIRIPPESTVIIDGRKETHISERSYSLASIIPVVTAICIGHFLIVAGGFMGERGYSKLLALEDWISSLFQSNPT